MRKIKQISITNLFGIFNHIIPLNMDDRVTIIHSPNGFGKTVLLRMLNELFSQGYKVLRTTPYSEFKIVFEEGSQLRITRKTESDPENQSDQNTKINPTEKLTFHYRDKKPEERSFTLKSISRREARDFIPLSAIDSFIPQLDRIGPDSWRDLSRGMILSFSDVFEIYGERLSDIPGFQMPYETEPDWLRELRGSIPVRLIETQRLLNPSRANKPSRHEKTSAMTPTVTMYSEELAENIKTKLAESTDLSQSLDRTFPRRLVISATKQSDITETELRIKLAELETKRASLMAAGLIDKDDNDAVLTDTIDASTKAVLSVYIEDVEQKLGVFDEIANKIDLLKRIINKRLY